MWLTPAEPNPRVAPTVVVHPEGSAWVLRSSQSANGLVKGILSRGGGVLGIDAFGDMPGRIWVLPLPRG